MKQPGPPAAPAFTLPPVRASSDRIMKITVCTRPFRAQGPRLEVEQIGSQSVVHNYGHGGSGWSLSWGSSTIAVQNALSGGQRRIGVIGCGALGMTSAILAQRAGAAVTIYAKELPPETRSTLATGSYTPDSRICLADQATPAFKQRWEQMARTSFKAYTNLLGLAGTPVEWVDTYFLTDTPHSQGQQQSAAANSIEFAQLQGELTPDLIAGVEDLPPGLHPFAPPYARRTSQLMFNLTAYQRLLLDEFYRNGGRIEVTEFHSPKDFARLTEKVLINATGYGARSLMGDQSVVPVRGQLARLIPQPEVTYSFMYDNVYFLPRRDGFVVQELGADEAKGYNDETAVPDRAEAERAVAVVGRACARMPRDGGVKSTTPH
jgi:glycine/D-amino acid oxidase-like deaminating enzyme